VHGPADEPWEPTAEDEQAMTVPSTHPEPPMGATMPAEDSRASALTRPLIPPDPAASDMYWPFRWPRRDGLELGAYPSAVPCARNRAREILREWQLARFTETATIAISELMTNACLATQAEALSTPVRLWMLGNSMSLGILVWDASTQLPIPRDAGELAESGRGLALVAAITCGEFDAAIGGRWGLYFPSADFQGGKVVWLLLQRSGITDPDLPQRQAAQLPAGWAPPRWEPPDPCTLARVHTALTAVADSSTHP
jgi:anti-sigma regulatory factor (Ser/Thr protein kinase)